MDGVDPQIESQNHSLLFPALSVMPLILLSLVGRIVQNRLQEVSVRTLFQISILAPVGCTQSQRLRPTLGSRSKEVPIFPQCNQNGRILSQYRVEAPHER